MSTAIRSGRLEAESVTVLSSYSRVPEDQQQVGVGLVAAPAHETPPDGLRVMLTKIKHQRWTRLAVEHLV
jgi:hypothetical protein